uniref:Peptidase_M13 domain-containing protein n=1 Tax=Parastrongyloides trichosuri TaxID=131310 RepID=A0A0N4ZZM1_PARTI
MNALIIKEVIGYENVNKRFEEAKIMFIEMKKILKEIIEGKKWLDRDTKDRIIKKVNDITYYDKIYNDYHNLTNVEKLYELLIYGKKQNYFFIKMYTKFFKELIENSLPEGYEGYIIEILTDNASYFTRSFKIFTLLGYMLEPIFDTHFMIPMKYGSLGSILGHEILHSLDHSNLGIISKYTSGEILSEYSRKEYNIRRQCLVDQYSKYDVRLPGTKIDGVATYDENLSDNSGLKLAYKAYKRYQEKYGSDKNKINGFTRYSNDQLFFISYAHSFCSKVTDEKKMEIINKKVYHLPSDLRIIISIGNQKEFSNAFNCKIGSVMNPKDKCEVWKVKH